MYGTCWNSLHTSEWCRLSWHEVQQPLIYQPQSACVHMHFLWPPVLIYVWDPRYRTQNYAVVFVAGYASRSLQLPLASQSVCKTLNIHAADDDSSSHTYSDAGPTNHLTGTGTRKPTAGKHVVCRPVMTSAAAVCRMLYWCARLQLSLIPFVEESRRQGRLPHD